MMALLTNGEFFAVPDFPNYCISRDGVLKNAGTGRIIAWATFKPRVDKNIKGGYKITNIYDRTGNRRGVSRHRLLALLFIPHHCDVKHLTVNHKNGIPGDDRLENLEWLTRGENIQHAYDNGLYPNKTVSVDLRYWQTGETMTFPSIEKCAEYTGLTYNTIVSRVRETNAMAYDDGMQLRKDSVEWVDPTVKLCRVRQRIPVVIEVVESGEKFSFAAMETGLRHVGLSVEYVRKKMEGLTVLEYKGYRITKLIGDAVILDYTKIGYGPSDV